MRLFSDELPEMKDVTTTQIEQILEEDAFGKFVGLMASDGVFIQAVCVWETGLESARFIEETGSDPFRLEYRDADSGRLLVADGVLTLEQVAEAFLEYANGQKEWLDRFTWLEVDG